MAYPCGILVAVDAAQNLQRLGAKRQRIEDELKDLRPRLAEAIRAASDEGMRQIDIVKATGYTREMVRRIVKGEAA